MRKRQALFLSPLNKGEKEEPCYGLCAACFAGGVRSRFIRLFSCNRGHASVNAVLVANVVEGCLVNFAGFPKIKAAQNAEKFTCHCLSHSASISRSNSAMVSSASLVQSGAAMTADRNCGWFISRSVLFSLGVRQPLHIANSSINSSILFRPPFTGIEFVPVIFIILGDLDERFT